MVGSGADLLFSAAMPAVQEALRNGSALRDAELVFFPRGLEVVAEGASVQAQYRQEFRSRGERGESRVVKKSLPVLQRLAGNLVLRVGSWEMNVAEQGVTFPCKCESVGLGERKESRGE